MMSGIKRLAVGMGGDGKQTTIPPSVDPTEEARPDCK